MACKAKTMERSRLTNPSFVTSVEARPPGVSLESMINHDGPSWKNQSLQGHTVHNLTAVQSDLVFWRHRDLLGQLQSPERLPIWVLISCQIVGKGQYHVHLQVGHFVLEAAIVDRTSPREQTRSIVDQFLLTEDAGWGQSQTDPDYDCLNQ